MFFYIILFESIVKFFFLCQFHAILKEFSIKDKQYSKKEKKRMLLNRLYDDFM